MKFILLTGVEWKKLRRSRILLIMGMAAVMLWTFWAAPADAPLAVVLVLEAVPLLIICGVLYALFQRIREIGRGESDDAKQY